MLSKIEKKDNRIVARATADVIDLIQKAANYSSASVSQFLISSAVEKAKLIIQEHEMLRLSLDGTESLLKALNTDANLNNKLTEAVKLYKSNINSDNY